MKLTHVELRNWRNFAHIEFDLNTRLFVVGPNAAGKSNLLDALRFISDVAKMGLREAAERRGGPKSVSYVFSEENTAFLAFAFAEGEEQKTYELLLSPCFAEEEGLFVIGERAKRATGAPTNYLEQINAKLARVNGDLIQGSEYTALQHDLTNEDIRDIRDFFADIHYIHPNPKKMLERGRYDEHATGFTQRAASLPDTVLAPAIARIRPILASIVHEIPNLTYERRGTGKDLDFYSDSYTGESNTSTVFSHDQFSEGTLRILGILFELATLPKDTSLVLIEEPELFMQPSVVRSLPDFFAAVAADRNVQMIITTHSPDLIDNELIRPDQVLMLEPTDTGTKGTLLSESQDPRVRSFVKTGFPLSNAVDSVNRRRIPLGIWDHR